MTAPVTIHITRSRVHTPLDSRLLEAWRSLETPIRIHEADAFEIHGELLERIYSGTLDDASPKHLISEIDFIPEPYMDDQIARWLDRFPLIYVPYVTRGADLLLTEHYAAGEKVPLSGAWFLAWNRALFAAEPNLQWLREGGPFNDAANLALFNLLKDGVINKADAALKLNGRSPARSLFVEYPSVGSHAFYHRHLNDAPESVLCGDITVAAHCAEITKRLK